MSVSICGQTQNYTNAGKWICFVFLFIFAMMLTLTPAELIKWKSFSTAMAFEVRLLLSAMELITVQASKAILGHLLPTSWVPHLGFSYFVVVQSLIPV